MEIRLLKKQMTAAYQYSFTRAALNYESLYEYVFEQPAGYLSDRITSAVNAVNDLMERYLFGDDVTEALKELRANMTHEVEILTAYTDAFEIYEYVLNRMERRFAASLPSEYNDETITSMVMGFISETKESSVMNARIKEVVGQLPVRLTKQKFFSLVMEGLSVYIGSSKKSLDGIMYTLRTESMADFPENMEEGHSDFYGMLEDFRRTDFKDITKDVYDSSELMLDTATEKMSEEADICVLIQHIINDLLVICLAGVEAVIDVNEEELYRSILCGVLDCFQREDDSALSSGRFDELLGRLEGRQETYYERYLRSELPEATVELSEDPDYLRAVNVDRLLSGSSFVDLQDHVDTLSDGAEDENGAGTVDRAYLEETAGAFFQELLKLFASESKPVVRAIMAKILSELPVFFNSVDEIKAYITGSLDSCGDEAEKETCKELLEKLIDYEDNMV